jgi:hypothetical protein
LKLYSIAEEEDNEVDLNSIEEVEEVEVTD